MKKFAALLLIAGSAVALSACETGNGMGNVDTQPPYSTERTASHSDSATVETRTPVVTEQRSDRVFRRVQTK